MKAVFILILLLIMSRFLFAIDNSNPTSVGKQYLTDITTGQAEQALNLVNEKTFLEKYHGDKTAFIEQTKERYQSINNQLGGVKTIIIDKVSFNKQKTEALLRVNIFYEKPFNHHQSEQGFLFMIKINDQWKVKYMDS